MSTSRDSMPVWLVVVLWIVGVIVLLIGVCVVLVTFSG